MTETINRRKFLKLAAGSTAGSVAVSALGVGAYYYATKSQSKLATQTIGDTSAISWFNPNLMWACPIIVRQDCTVTAVGINSLRSNGLGTSVQTGIYNDSGGVPNALLGHSNSVNLVSGPSWYDCPLISNVSLTKDTQYWLGWMTNNPPDGDTATGFYAYYQVIDPGIHYRYDPGFGTWPNPGTSGLLNRNVIFNMRITYTTNQTSNEVVAALLGTVVGSIVTSGIILLRDKAQDHQLRISRKSIAYAHLKETLTRIEAKSGSNFKTAKLNEKNYDMLQETVANNYDVLDKDTVKAWTSKKITHHVTNGVFDYEINLEQFKEDVMRH